MVEWKTIIQRHLGVLKFIKDQNRHKKGCYDYN